MLLLKGFSLMAIASFVALAAVGRQPGLDGKPTYCGRTRDIPFVGDLPCEAVDLTVYFLAFVCVVSVLAFAWGATRRV
jgi:hypothetical protein